MSGCATPADKKHHLLILEGRSRASQKVPTDRLIGVWTTARTAGLLSTTPQPG
jgi:hypothetical protein